MNRIAAALLAVCTMAASAHAQTRVRLPTSFYDIEIRESLTSGTSSRMGGMEGMRAAPPRGDGPGGGFQVPESSGMAQFVIRADSMLYRSGRDIVSLAIADFVSVDEVRPGGRADLAWVRIAYRRGDQAKEVFLRRYQARNQTELRDALQAAMSRYAESRTQTP